MHTDSQMAASSPPLFRYGKLRHAMVGRILPVLVMLMMSACGEVEPEQPAEIQVDDPRQAIAVQMPASQWPGQQLPQSYIAPPVQQPQAPMPANGNPWAVRTQPRRYGQHPSQRWGQPQPRQPQYQQQYAPPQYQQPPAGLQYRPLEPESARVPQAPPVQPPVQSYRPVAPYDRLYGSSFGTPSYPYGGAYPSYYGAGVYAPGWPGYR